MSYNEIYHTMKKIITLFLVISTCLLTKAQLPVMGLGKSSGQEIVEKAIASNIGIVRLPYRLKQRSTGALFGRDGKEEFGRSYSIAVLTDEGYITAPDNVKPWEDDNAYSKFRPDYEAFLASTALRSPQDSVFSPSKVETDNDFAYINGKQQTLGLPINRAVGEVRGWLVWYKADEDLSKNEKATISCTPILKTITICDTLKRQEITDIPKGENYIGGCFVTIDYTGNGVVEFKLSGFIERSIDKWNLYTPFAEKAAEKSNTETTVTRIGSGELTPAELTPLSSPEEEKVPTQDTVKKNKKNKK